jgi:hypothetical protein
MPRDGLGRCPPRTDRRQAPHKRHSRSRSARGSSGQRPDDENDACRQATQTLISTARRSPVITTSTVRLRSSPRPGNQDSGPSAAEPGGRPRAGSRAVPRWSAPARTPRGQESLRPLPTSHPHSDTRKADRTLPYGWFRRHTISFGISIGSSHHLVRLSRAPPWTGDPKLREAPSRTVAARRPSSAVGSTASAATVRAV